MLNFLKTEILFQLKIVLQKFHSHAFLKSACQSFPIKTERNIECRLRVKNEPNSSPQINHSKSKSIPSNWQNEKKQLVQKVVSLKAENDKHLLAFKKMEADYSTLLNEKQDTEQQMSKEVEGLSEQNDELKSELSKATRELIEIKTSNEKVISGLKRENQLLLARVKQYQTGMQQGKSSGRMKKQTHEQNQEYEVEAILQHKETDTGRQYLIHWKGYDSSYDTWESETNIKCPRIFNKYIRSIDSKRK